MSLGYDEYLPCPLCNTKARSIPHDRDTWLEVKCSNDKCGCKIEASSILQAQDIWNSRPCLKEETDPERIKKFKELLGKEAPWDKTVWK